MKDLITINELQDRSVESLAAIVGGGVITIGSTSGNHLAIRTGSDAGGGGGISVTWTGGGFTLGIQIDPGSGYEPPFITPGKIYTHFNGQMFNIMVEAWRHRP